MGELKKKQKMIVRAEGKQMSFFVVFFWKKSFLLMKEKENPCSACSRSVRR